MIDFFNLDICSINETLTEYPNIVNQIKLFHREDFNECDKSLSVVFIYSGVMVGYALMRSRSLPNETLALHNISGNEGCEIICLYIPLMNRPLYQSVMMELVGRIKEWICVWRGGLFDYFWLESSTDAVIHCWALTGARLVNPFGCPKTNNIKDKDEYFNLLIYPIPFNMIR